MIRKHSVSLHGHRTSFSLEDAFYDELKSLAERNGKTLAQQIRIIDDTRRPEVNLSSAIRLAVLADMKDRLSQQGVE